MHTIDWSIPGQWTLGRYVCNGCGLDAWADLPYNLGVLTPCYIDTRSGNVTRPCGPDWYVGLTRRAWQNRQRQPVTIKKVVHRPARKVVLVPALGNCWGDAIMTVAKMNALGQLSDIDVVLISTANMAPHIPANVAEAWLVEMTHPQTAVWNDELADTIKREVSRFDECYLPVIFQLPSLTPGEVEALSGVTPFDRSRWDDELARAPVVTFMWREDRCWDGEPRASRRLFDRADRIRGSRRVTRWWHRMRARGAPQRQFTRVVELAREIREALPGVDFGVCGQGSYGRFPDWIKDLRSPHANSATNSQWCARAAQSHVLIGVLGSQMVLPSGHAGGVIDLIPSDFLRNVLTDCLVTTTDPREALFLYRNLPLATEPVDVARTAVAMLVNYSMARSSLHADFYRPLDEATAASLAALQDARSRILERVASTRAHDLIGP